MQRVGQLLLDSGKLVISDGMDSWGEDFIKVPSGAYEVWIEYGQPTKRTEFFGSLIDRVLVTNSGFNFGAAMRIGEVGVDSAKIFLSDKDALEKYWEDEGPLRIGEVQVVGEDPTPAELVCREFGLEAESVWFGTARLKGEVSKPLEEEITQFLQSFPRFQRNTFLYFSIYSGNTFERFNFYNKRFGMLPIDSAESAFMAITQTGFGDGVYPIFTRSDGSSRMAVEVSFRGTYTEQFIADHFAK